MTGTVIVYGLLAVVFGLGLSTLRVLELWRLVMIPAALALAITGFFVAGFGVGLLAWCLFATLTAITTIIVQHREFRGQARPIVYVFSSLAMSLILWPVVFPFLLQAPIEALDNATIADADPPPTVVIETDGGSQLPDTRTFTDVLGDTPRGKVQGQSVDIDVHDLGRLSLPSGRVIACDGVVLDGVPFEANVRPGEYSVLVAVARLPNGDERIAFARVQLSATPAARWTAATCPGEDPATLKPGERFGYGVDSGVGAFIAGEAIEDLQTEIPDHMDYMIHRMGETTRPSWSWIRMRAEHGNGIIFSSGWGDGHYASYIGYDEDGNVTALLTSFDVVEWEP